MTVTEAVTVSGITPSADYKGIENTDDNDRHDLPQLEAPKQPLSVSVTASGYIVTSSAGSCKMQMQLRLVYYQPKGVST